MDRRPTRPPQGSVFRPGFPRAVASRSLPVQGGQGRLRGNPTVVSARMSVGKCQTRRQESCTNRRGSRRCPRVRWALPTRCPRGRGPTACGLVQRALSCARGKNCGALSQIGRQRGERGEMTREVAGAGCQGRATWAPRRRPGGAVRVSANDNGTGGLGHRRRDDDTEGTLNWALLIAGRTPERAPERAPETARRKARAQGPRRRRADAWRRRIRRSRSRSSPWPRGPVDKPRARTHLADAATP